jgi:hypothetical protein
MTINELIKKYEEELKNCIEQKKVWEKEFSKTDDENYKFACREYIMESRIQKIFYNRFLQDLKQLKEKIIKRQFTKSYISTNQDNSLMAVESMIKEIIGE